MSKDNDEAREYKHPDAEKAFGIYDDQIAPKLEHMATIKGDLAEPWGYIKDANMPKKVLNFIIALENMEDAKRDHYLVALNEGLRVRDISMPRDLLSIANGDSQTSVIPVGEREDDELLVDAADREDDFEAKPEELEKQDGRKRRTARTPAAAATAPKKGSVSNVTPLH